MRDLTARPRLLACALAVLLCLLALARPLDHDESQYVAAALLSAHGLLPYRDYAYLQTPLQPFLFAPIAWLAGGWAWPALRIVNALLGAASAVFVWRAARTGGANAQMATAATALFATCDILLFATGTARNDALPAALFAASLAPILQASRDRATNRSAFLSGLLLAGAAAAKVSYALPAAAYGLIALLDRRHRPLWVAIGALPAMVLVALSWRLAPGAFVFDTLSFPSAAPAEYYRAVGKAWKLGIGMKLVDTLKFLALGPALAALALIPRYRWRRADGRALDWLLVAAFLAALLPVPTWRQYLLPMLPPLFVRLAIGWSVVPPERRTRVAMVVFACAGLAPSIAALGSGLPLLEAMRQGYAIRATMDANAVRGPVATLAPQFLAATGRLPDPRLATGPFYFRSRGLLDSADENADHLVGRDTLAAHFAAAPPPALLTGGESGWTSGDAALDIPLAHWAAAHGYRAVAIPGGRFTLYLAPARANFGSAAPIRSL